MDGMERATAKLRRMVVLVIIAVVTVSVIAYFQVLPTSQTNSRTITVTNQVVEENVLALRACAMNYSVSITTYIVSPSGPTGVIFFTTTQYLNYTTTTTIAPPSYVRTIVNGTTITQACG